MHVIKVPLILKTEEEKIIDGQSKILNWTYNHLLQIANGLRAEYVENQDKDIVNTLYTKRGLRNLLPKFKKEYLFYYLSNRFKSHAATYPTIYPTTAALITPTTAVPNPILPIVCIS